MLYLNENISCAVLICATIIMIAVCRQCPDSNVSENKTNVKQYLSVNKNCYFVFLQISYL